MKRADSSNDYSDRRPQGLGPPEIKICGVTTPDDARLAVLHGAAYVGVNFFSGSPRCVGVETARSIRDAVAGDIPLVGVFVNHPLEQVEAIDSAVGLDLLQFHGDEQAVDIARFASRAVRAFRWSESFDFGRLQELDGFFGVLFDAPHDTLYGGSGESWSYGRLAELWNHPLAASRVWVAGGIRPSNVRSVITALPHVDVLDVCSGVESSPGIKSSALLEELFSEAQHGKDRNTTGR